MRRQSIYVPLSDGATDKLRELARRELRDPKTQAAYLILAGLRAAGLDPEPAERMPARHDTTR